MNILNNSPLSALMSKKPHSVLKETLPDVYTDQDKAFAFFHKILGLPEIKENLYLNIIAKEQINTLLIGPPATSKSLFMKVISEKCNDVIFFDASTGGTGAGLISLLQANKKAKILIIDEIDKLKKNDQNVLLGLLNDGRVTKALKDDVIDFQMEIKVFATSNSSAKLSKPIKSRFETYVLPEYSAEEFVKVVQHCLSESLLPSTAEVLATVLINNDMKDVRIAINLARKIQKHHTEEDVKRIIENKLKFSSADSLVEFN